MSRAWLAIAVGAVLVATLPPQPEWSGAGRHFAVPVMPSKPGAWFDVLQNVVLYVPLGIALAARGSGVVKAGLLGAALSLVTELLQFLVPGRDSSANDLIANTVGALTGAALLAGPGRAHILRFIAAAQRRVRRLALPSRRHAGLLSLAWAAILATLLAASAFLMLPAPPGPPYLVSSPLFDRKPGPLLIGGNGFQDGYFAGLIDEVRLYPRALDREAIRADMARPVRDSDQTATAIAAYGFDDGDGTKARDATNHGHDGAVVRAQWTASGRLGGALAFDGRSSMVVVPASAELELTDAMTIEAWVFPYEQPAAEPAIVAHVGGSYFLSASSDGRPLLPAGGGTFGGLYDAARPVEPLALRTWTHMAVTYDGKAIRMYINGEEDSIVRRWSAHRPASASLDGMNLLPGIVADGASFQRALRGNAAIGATIVCGPSDRSLAAVFHVVGLHDVQVLTLKAKETDLHLATATLPRRLGFAAPDFRIPHALASCPPGRSIHLRMDGPLQNPRATIDGQPVRGQAPGVASGWALIFHSQLLPAPLQMACTLLWVVLLLFPFGFWARPTLASAAGAAILVLAFALLPRVFDVASLGTSESAACLAGVVAGWLAGLRASLKHHRLDRLEHDEHVKSD